MRTRMIAGLLLAILVFPACGALDGGTNQSTNTSVDEWPGNTSDSHSVQLAAGISMDVPMSWEVTVQDAEQRREAGDDCVVTNGQVGEMSYTLIGSGCTDAGNAPGNGDSSFYLTPELAEPRAVDFETNDVAAGTFTTFEQGVFVCTSECYEASETVGLLQFDTPPGDAPTLMFHDFETITSVDRMVALATAVQVTA